MHASPIATARPSLPTTRPSLAPHSTLRLGPLWRTQAIARTDTMTFEQAYAVSKYVLKHADYKGTETLDFAEYFTAQGERMSLEEYAKAIQALNVQQENDVNQMRKAWDEIMEDPHYAEARAQRQQRGVEADARHDKAKGVKIVPAPVLNPTM